MHNIIFYQTPNGDQPVKNYLVSLKNSTNPDNLDLLEKIQDYIRQLRIHGTQIGPPYVKLLRDGIYELRPKRVRILFFHCKDNGYVLLNCIEHKKTNAIPNRYIQKAQKQKNDYLRRL